MQILQQSRSSTRADSSHRWSGWASVSRQKNGNLGHLGLVNCFAMLLCIVTAIAVIGEEADFIFGSWGGMISSKSQETTMVKFFHFLTGELLDWEPRFLSAFSVLALAHDLAVWLVGGLLALGRD